MTNETTSSDDSQPIVVEWAPVTAKTASPAPGRKRRRRPWLILLGVYLIGVAVMLVVGALALRDARRHLGATKSELTLSNLSATATPAATKTADAMGRAHAMFGSPVVAPLRLVPVVGRQLRAVSAMSAASKQVIDVGIEARRRGATIVERAAADGDARVRALTELEAVVARSVGKLDDIDLGPSNNLLGPLASARADFAAELNRLGETLQRADVAAKGLTKFLEGPSRYAVFAANNAEMRSGSGMCLFAGTLSVDNGALTLGPMRSILDLPPAPNNVALEYDYLRLWGTQAPGSDYRFVNMTPRFPTSGSLLKRLWDASGGEPVDGVLVVDPVAAVELIKAVGNVTVDGRTITADNGLSLFLHDQYVDYDTVKPTARRDFLAEAVGQLFAKVNSGGIRPNVLGAALGEAAAGRHLLAWADDAAVQRGWNALGMDGVVPDDSLMFALQNRGGTKLDYFQRVSAVAKATVSQAGSTLSMDFLITNATPKGEPTYIAGPVTGSYVTTPGTYVGIASINLPARATKVKFSGGDLTNGDYDLVSGPDGNTQVVSKWLQIDPGESVRLRLEFTLPAGSRSLTVLPSARRPTVFWHIGKTTWHDEKAQVIRW